MLVWTPTSQAKGRPGTPAVTIYLQSGPTVPVTVLGRAQWVATRIFASIGVPVKWHIGMERRARDEAAMTIEMQLVSGAPETFHPGALAYSMPYGTAGTRIHVFCDRVLGVSSHELGGAYLGHVMAHEITHVLEGISRHSAEGVMKAHWDVNDFYQMVYRPLRFATRDVDLIYEAWERRKQAD
jgi:hypothetical protein